MRYCYCTECDKLRPRNWYARNKCEICDGKCTVIEVRRSFWGYLMYLLDIVAVIFIVIYLFSDSLSGALGEFVQSLGMELIALLFFLLIGGSLICAYFDLKETNLKAERKVAEIKLKKNQQS